MELKRTLLSAGVIVLLGIAPAAWADGDAEAGKAKAGTCAGCHGANGEGTASGPALAGMKKDKFEREMKAYKSGKKDNAMMKSLASGLSEKDIDNLAAYYASLKGK